MKSNFTKLLTTIIICIRLQIIIFITTRLVPQSTDIVDRRQFKDSLSLPRKTVAGIYTFRSKILNYVESMILYVYAFLDMYHLSLMTN